MPVETSYCRSSIMVGSRHSFLAHEVLSPFSLFCVVVIYTNGIGTPGGDLGVGKFLVSTPAQGANAFDEGGRKVLNGGTSVVNRLAHFHERPDAGSGWNILGSLLFPNSEARASDLQPDEHVAESRLTIHKLVSRTKRSEYQFELLRKSARIMPLSASKPWTAKVSSIPACGIASRVRIVS